MDFILIQGVGALAFMLGIIMYQVNRRSRILILQTIYNLLYGVQYFLLGGVNSMLMCIIGAVRNLVFYNDDKISKRNRVLAF